MSLNSTTITTEINGGEAVSFGNVTQNVNFDHKATVTLTDGTGTGNAQKEQFVLVSAVTGGTTIDLSALTGGLDGGTRNYTAIKAIHIDCTGCAASVTIQPGASNGWLGINGAATGNPLTVDAGGVWMRVNPAAGITVDGTHKTILFTAASGTQSVKVSIAGLGT